MLVPIIDVVSECGATAPHPTQSLSNLMIDLLELAVIRPQTLEEAFENWPYSCPRVLPWEDALNFGLIAISRANGRSRPQVRLTTAGLLALRSARRNRVLQQCKQDHQ